MDSCRRALLSGSDAKIQLMALLIANHNNAVLECRSISLNFMVASFGFSLVRTFTLASPQKRGEEAAGYMIFRVLIAHWFCPNQVD